MIRSARLCLLLLVTGLWGCPGSKYQVKQIPITRQARMTLLQPKELGQMLRASQIFTFRRQGKAQTLYVQLEVDATRIVMVGLTPIGAKLFVLSLQGGKLTYSPEPYFKARIQPVHVLADFQLTFWPLKLLQKRLKRSGLSIRESNVKGKRLRMFAADEKTLIRISYTHAKNPWKGTIQFHHIERNYRYTIRSVQVEKIPETSTAK